MRFRASLVAAAVVLTAVLAGGSARADVAYRYVAGTTGYTGNAGQSIVVPLFLEETVTSPSTSLLTGENGLLGTGVRATRSGSVPSSPALLTAIASDAIFTGIGTAPQVTTTAAQISDTIASSATSGPTGSVVGTGVRRVPLGTVTLTLGSTLNQVTTFTLSPFVNVDTTTGGNTVTYANFYDLDATSASPAFTGATTSTFTATVVPEPASVGLVGALAGGMLLVRRRRGRGGLARAIV